MAAKGTLAKDVVINTIAKAFGKDFVGVIDKKVYVWADDGGERVQIALSLTCPKTFVEGTGVVPEMTPLSSTGGIDFEAASVVNTTISQEEQDRISELLKKLDL